MQLDRVVQASPRQCTNLHRVHLHTIIVTTKFKRFVDKEAHILKPRGLEKIVPKNIAVVRQTGTSHYYLTVMFKGYEQYSSISLS